MKLFQITEAEPTSNLIETQNLESLFFEIGPIDRIIELNWGSRPDDFISILPNATGAKRG